MAFSPSGGFSAVSTTPNVVRTPAIDNIALVDTSEHAIALPVGTKTFTFRSRTPAILKVAYASGETTSKYLTFSIGESYNSLGQGLVLDTTTALTIYVAASQPTVLELERWS